MISENPAAVSAIVAVTCAAFVAVVLVAKTLAWVVGVATGDRPREQSRRRLPMWAFMRVFVVHDDAGGVYLWRLRVVETPWFALWLHAIHQSDHGRDLHDHPRPFFSLLLRGEYREEIMVRWYDVPGGASSICARGVRWWNAKRSDDAHRITWLSRVPVWTLVFCGPRCREWGFLTNEGWVEADEYFTRGHAIADVGSRSAFLRQED